MPYFNVTFAAVIFGADYDEANSRAAVVAAQASQGLLSSLGIECDLKYQHDAELCDEEDGDEEDEECACPVGDPECEGGEGDCHDACEMPAEWRKAMTTLGIAPPSAATPSHPTGRPNE